MVAVGSGDVPLVSIGTSGGSATYINHQKCGGKGGEYVRITKRSTMFFKCTNCVLNDRFG